MAGTLGTVGYFLFIILCSILAVAWILLPIVVFGIRKRLDKIIELLSHQAQR